MASCLGKSCSFGLPRVPLVNCCQFVYLVILLFRFEGSMVQQQTFKNKSIDHAFKVRILFSSTEGWNF